MSLLQPPLCMLSCLAALFLGSIWIKSVVSHQRLQQRADLHENHMFFVLNTLRNLPPSSQLQSALVFLEAHSTFCSGPKSCFLSYVIKCRQTYVRARCGLQLRVTTYMFEMSDHERPKPQTELQKEFSLTCCLFLEAGCFTIKKKYFMPPVDLLAHLTTPLQFEHLKIMKWQKWVTVWSDLQKTLCLLFKPKIRVLLGDC